MKKNIVIIFLIALSVAFAVSFSAIVLALESEENIPASNSLSETGNLQTEQHGNNEVALESTVTLSSLSRATPSGTEVIGAEALAQLRSIIAEGSFLTLERAIQISEMMQNLYESDETTFILNSFTLPNSNVAKWSEPVVLQKPSTEGMKMGSEELAGARYWQIEQMNQMIAYSLLALTPEESLLPMDEIYTQLELMMMNIPFCSGYDLLLLEGNYDTREEAIALIREKSEDIAYIQCGKKSAYYICGETCIPLTLDSWGSEEALAYFEEYRQTDEYRQWAEDYGIELEN